MYRDKVRVCIIGTGRAGICLVAVLVSAIEYATEAKSAQLVHLGTVASDVIGLTIRSDQCVEYGRQIAYTKQEGHKVDDTGVHRWVYRDGKLIGSLAGTEREILHIPDRLVGEPFDISPAEEPSNWRITSLDDPNYAVDGGRHPKSVHRKSRPTDMVRTGSWKFDAPVEHTLYLKLPHPLQQSRHYTLTPSSTSLASIDFTWEPSAVKLFMSAILDFVLMILQKLPFSPAGWETSDRL